MNTTNSFSPGQRTSARTFRQAQAPPPLLPPPESVAPAPMDHQAAIYYHASDPYYVGAQPNPPGDEVQLALHRLERSLVQPWYYRWLLAGVVLLLVAVVGMVAWAVLGPQQKGLRHDLDLQRLRLDEVSFERRSSVPREDEPPPPGETERTLRFDSLSLSANCSAWFASSSRVVRCTVLEGQGDWMRDPVAHFDTCCAGDLSRLICGLPAELVILHGRAQAVLGLYDGAASQEMLRRPRRCSLYLFFDKG